VRRIRQRARSGSAGVVYTDAANPHLPAVPVANDWPVKTILAPIDFSPVSQRVIASAVELARRLRARVVLLHAVERPVFQAGVIPVRARISEFTVALEAGARLHLLRVQRDLVKRRTSVETRCVTGAVVPSILAAAQQLRANYLILGSHGHNAGSQRVVGGTAAGVVHRAACPVVIVPVAPRRRPVRPARSS